MEITRNKLCARILVWNARNGLKHMLINSISNFNHLTINYARHALRAHGTIQINYLNINFLFCQVWIQIACSLLNYDS